MNKDSDSKTPATGHPGPSPDSSAGWPTGKFPVVGIGASAGGLQALSDFFANMPADSGMAFVVIQHLNPNQDTILDKLLKKHTSMNIEQAVDAQIVKPNHIYILPPNKSMSIIHNTLHLVEPVIIKKLHLPVDFFFRSLATERNSNSIGIILSGMGSDGSIGLRAIKEKAGLALVQDPESAEFDSMPKNAIQSVQADIVAPTSDLPGQLIELMSREKRSGIHEDEDADTEALEGIIALLRNHTGNDFSQYKKNTLYRRIERRMGIHKTNSISEYLSFLEKNTIEVNILFNEMLIGVTNFFRDLPVWEHLKEKIIPQILSASSEGSTIRAWVPSCSTGEEAYSLAIVFREAMEKMANPLDISLQIFATDLDTSAIEKARKGIYPANIVSDVSASRLSRYFTSGNGKYQIKPSIRGMVVFAPQNLIKDPPFSKLDIISCRNFLIYINSELQQKLLRIFHNSIKAGGYLVLGSSETNNGQDDWFSPVEPKLKIYKHTGKPTKEGVTSLAFSSTSKQPLKDDLQATKENLQTLADQLILQQYSPASVMSTKEGDIVYITGSTGKYLEPAAGKANFNLFAMAREGLRAELPLAFRKAISEKEVVVLSKVKMSTHGERISMADVIIRQIEKPQALKGKILLVFKDLPPEPEIKLPEKKSGENRNEDLLQAEIERLGKELALTREKMEASNEELNSTNEELLSTNEALTTSKEEMQSLNEELHTTNIELQNKVYEATRARNDIHNLMNSIDIAALFLDRELKIRQYTSSTLDIFKFIPSDIGRHFTDQVSDLVYPDIYDDAQKVLNTLTNIRKEITTKQGEWYNVKIMPYHTFDGMVDGLVVTFIDITQSKKKEQAMLTYQALLRSLVREVPKIVLSLNQEGEITEFNPLAEKLLSCDKDRALGKRFVDLFVPENLKKETSKNFHNLFSGSSPEAFNITVKALDGRDITLEWARHKLFDANGDFRGIILIGSEV